VDIEHSFVLDHEQESYRTQVVEQCKTKASALGIIMSILLFPQHRKNTYSFLPNPPPHFQALLHSLLNQCPSAPLAAYKEQQEALLRTANINIRLQCFKNSDESQERKSLHAWSAISPKIQMLIAGIEKNGEMKVQCPVSFLVLHFFAEHNSGVTHRDYLR